MVHTRLGDAAPLAVVGGLAVSVRTEPRFTRDVDLAVATRGDAEAEQLVLQLQRVGYRALVVLEHERGVLATVRLLPPGGSTDGVLVDLLFNSSGIEREIVAGAEALEVLPGVILPVAQVGHLLALKLLSVDDRRPNDAADIAALHAVATPTELARCREAIVLIEGRGFARGRDLGASLSRLGG